MAGNHGINLEGMAHVVGWCTPMAQDHSRGGSLPRPQDTGVPLSQQAALAGWLTPSTLATGERSEESMEKRTAARLAAPNCMDTMPARSDEALARAKQKAGCSNLKDQIPLAGFATPRATKNTPAQREDFTPNLAMNALSMIGQNQTGYTAETKSTGQLNPALSRWLMGFPEEWDIAAIQASRLMPTTRKKRES